MDLQTYARQTGIRPREFRDKLATQGVELSTEIVRRWFAGLQPVGVKNLQAIEKATSGKVKREHVRPDIFGRA